MSHKNNFMHFVFVDRGNCYANILKENQYAEWKDDHRLNIKRIQETTSNTKQKKIKAFEKPKDELFSGYIKYLKKGE